MKYILQHPIHESSHQAWDNPHQSLEGSEEVSVHHDAETYANVGHIGHVKADAEHRLSTGTEMSSNAKSIAGQNDVAKDPNKHRLSDIAANGEKAHPTMQQHVLAKDPNNHRLSDIAESADTETEQRTKIIRFADFQK